MLILWTKEGQSELKITLCNQSGTLKISRDSMLFPLPGNPMEFEAMLTETKSRRRTLGLSWG